MIPKLKLIHLPFVMFGLCDAASRANSFYVAFASSSSFHVPKANVQSDATLVLICRRRKTTLDLSLLCHRPQSMRPFTFNRSLSFDYISPSSCYWFRVRLAKCVQWPADSRPLAIETTAISPSRKQVFSIFINQRENDRRINVLMKPYHFIPLEATPPAGRESGRLI